jgi:acyl-CoA synthetase (AMP-forming)/AMP-acid ligase II
VAAFALAPADHRHDDDERLVLFVESREPALPKAALEELLATVRRRVNEDHGLSCAAILVGTAGLVRKTTSGKVRRHACLEAYLHPETLAASAVLGVYTAGPAP